ncbi:MAG: MFS transporter [Candidatus Aquicultor secundus]|uniref:MFS transporter n=1 Tax=Candidatus Aquicultor secundus TaxID=1973895 RepID=A0A2M7T7P3_9ACTN|nr:MFS transporter [Candidatus Aquicultor secundus]NCO66159.1 MFS transporter [Solirubrobacter sp.]OIO83390.1 MAG: MFS transporter [Candidatus Aquicultor secundus]PIU27353.1 MAG: MFS transporter [Candidatus Aquicultor secundus]PIW22931.1 MAG: MFS transporter [Candidatus Aquicultor secundus]PIX51920.1 MAG: MFS transporter [Candidatus Aquicultor secundus]
MKQQNKKILGFSRNVFFVGLTSFFTDISTEMVYPLIPIFLTTVLGAPVAIVGLVEGIAESTASLLKVISGWLSDRTQRRKRLTVLGYGLAAIAKPLLALSFVWWQVLIARFVDRFGKGVRTSPRDALIADSTSSEDYGKAFGFHRGMDTLGAAFGPLIAFAALPLLHNNFRLYFSFAIIPAVIGVVVLALFVKEKVRAAKVENLRLSLKPFNRQFKLFLLIVLIFTVGNSSDAFLILRANNVGVAVGLIPLVYFVFNTVYALASTPIGALSDRIGRKVVIIAGYLIFAIVYLGFALVKSPFTIWLLFAAYGLYYAFTEGIFKAFTADLVPENLRGTAYGFLSLVLGIALLPASLIAGFLWDKISPSAPFFFGSAVSLIALVLFMALIPNDNRNNADA